MKDKNELSIEDIKEFKLALEKTANTQIIDFFTIILNTGFRATELLDLKFTDIEYKSNSLTMGLKKRSNNLYHRILNDECMKVLIRLKDEHPNDVFVFQSRKSKNQTNKPASSISRQVVTKAFKTASDITSLPITTSDLRHIYASQIFSMSSLQNVDHKFLSRFIGHESMSMTMDYVSDCHVKDNESLNCLSAPKADMTNREPEIIKYLLNGGPLSENCDLDNICKHHGISETDLAITLKTVKILAKPMRSGKKS